MRTIAIDYLFDTAMQRISDLQRDAARGRDYRRIAAAAR